MDSKENNHSEDILRIEGVKAKGYGTIPKIVMKDHDLLIIDKSLYSYFCSLSGKGDSVFPGRNKILFDLQFNKETYYKSLNNLIEQGYIIVKQTNTGGKGYGFKHNEYTIVSKPKKYTNIDQQIMLRGLDVHGYGIIPYSVMSDIRMRPQTKAVYAYIVVMIGGSSYADLSTAIMAHDLGCDIQTIQRHIRKLKELNYISVMQIRQNGRITGTRYAVNQNPATSTSEPIQITFVSEPDTQKPDTQKPDTQKPDTQKPDTQKPDTQKPDTQKPDTQKPDTQKSDTQNQDTQNQDTQKPDTIINSITINSITNNRNIISDRLIDRVKKILRYELLELIYDDNPACKPDLDLLVETMVDVLGSPAPRVTIGGEPMATNHVRDVLLQHATPDAAIKVLERFWARAHKIEKKNHKQYLLTSIYRESLYPTATDDTDDPVDSIYSQG